MKDIAFDLLKHWCDRLLELQITQIPDGRLFGGILCPACHRIHGRSADAIPALLYLHDQSGDPRYLTGAKRLFEWSEGNMSRSDGGMHNDSNLAWNGITVFSAIALGEALLHWERRDADPIFYQSMKDAFAKKAAFVREERFMDPLPQINYIASAPAALALSARILQNDDHRTEAKRRFALVFSQFVTKQNFLFGEIHPPTKRSERGSVAVDMGYNLEESYPNLALYAHLAQDPEAEAQVAELFRAALPFLLPDGAIDNSWGCRSDKWTYYGSRTSDGMAGGLALLSRHDPAFLEAARRNLLLMERCTVNGLLSGGLMYGDAHEPVCTHHAISHSRSLTTLLRLDLEEKYAPLPCDAAENRVMHDPESGVLRVHRGAWSASVSDSDLPPKTPGKTAGFGGALTLLYHRTAGVVSAGSMTKFHLAEPNNMQIPRHQEHHDCTTPRLVRGAFSNVFDREAQVSCEETAEETAITVRGVLTDLVGSKDLPYTIRYLLSDKELRIELSAPEDSEFLFYAVSDEERPLTVSHGEFRFLRNGVPLSLCTDGTVIHAEPRLFTPCGGFLSFPLRIRGAKHVTLASL